MLSPAPKPDEETKYSAERGWNPGLYRFLYRLHPELASAGLSLNPFRGMGPLFCTARESGGLILSCNKLASDRRAPLDVPAKGTTKKKKKKNVLHRHSFF